jgi:hypothetical protein
MTPARRVTGDDLGREGLPDFEASRISEFGPTQAAEKLAAFLFRRRQPSQGTQPVAHCPEPAWLGPVSFSGRVVPAVDDM